jgi:tetratricopeptide (TPR) repeat protein
VFNRGLSHVRIGDLDDAVTDFTRAIRLNPDDPAGFLQRGHVHLDQNDADRAAADFTMAIQLDADDTRGYLARSQAHRRRKDWPAVIADATTVLAKEPDSIDAFNTRAGAHYALGDYTAALADHSAAMAVDADDAATLNYLAWLYATCPDDAIRNGVLAVDLAENACESTRYEVAGFLDTLAAAYAEVGRFDDAVFWQKKVIEKVPGDAFGYAERLKCYEAKSAWRDA